MQSRYNRYARTANPWPSARGFLRRLGRGSLFSRCMDDPRSVPSVYSPSGTCTPLARIAADGLLEVEDIVQVLAKIKDISFDEAYAVAHLILEEADAGRAPVQADTLPETGKAETGKINFVEYMASSESGSKMISFDSYLNQALKIAKIRPESDHDACKRAFERARQLSFLGTRARTAAPDPPTVGNDGPPEPGQLKWLQQETPNLGPPRVLPHNPHPQE